MSLDAERNRLQRRDRKYRRQRAGMRVDNAARRLAQLLAQRLKGSQPRPPK